MASKRHEQPAHKACVVGLDGVPFSMITRFMDEGVMPNMRSIVERGRIVDMTVVLPEISSVSWSSFMTGKNPGEHGIFGFTDLHQGTYKMSFPSFGDLKTDTIWDRIGAAGMRSVVINQPATYPARPIHGALVSGFVSVHLDKSVFPAKYLRTLTDSKYEVDIEAENVVNDPAKLYSELDRFLNMRLKLMDVLWKEEDWKLMEVIVTRTDRLHHFGWDAYEDSNHVNHGDFRNYYRNVDRFIGDVYQKFCDHADGYADNFFLLSDHGFCGTRHEVYINKVLADAGYLHMNKPDARGLEDISEKSTAFALDPARIYVHQRGKFPRGSVGDRDVERIKSELKARFEGLKDGEGNPIIRKIFDGNDVYAGPHAHRGPDMCLVPYQGFDLKGRLGADTVVGTRRLQGMHTWDDAFFATARKDLLTEESGFTLLDIPPKILQSLEVE